MTYGRSELNLFASSCEPKLDSDPIRVLGTDAFRILISESFGLGSNTSGCDQFSTVIGSVDDFSLSVSLLAVLRASGFDFDRVPGWSEMTIDELYYAYMIASIDPLLRRRIGSKRGDSSPGC